MKKITVLITGAGAPGAPGIIKSLREQKEIEIVGTDVREDAVGSVLVDQFFVIEKADSENYLSSLLKVVEETKADVILPLNTKELVKLSKNQEMFKDTKISISSPEALEKANNKYLLMKACRENNLPVPEFKLVDNYQDFEKAVLSLGYPEKNVCFKPPVSNGLRGFRILTEKIDRLEILINEKPNNTLTTLEEIKPILSRAEVFPELLVMEYLPGKEYSVDLLVNNGETIVTVPRERQQLKMGISFVGKTVNNQEIIDCSEKIASLLKLNGNIGFQFKEDEEGNPKIIECNPRLQGTVNLCTAAGANLVYLAVKLALKEEIEKPKVKWNVKMIRYWEAIFKHE